MKFNKDYFTKDYYFNRKRSNYLNYNYFDRNIFWEPVVKVVKKHKMTGNFLDLGCAFGFLAKRIIPYFTEIYGLDISSYAINHAKKEIDTVKFVCADLTDGLSSYSDEFFDCIAALDILEHTPSVKESLEIIVKKLKQGGYIIIGFPVRDSFIGRLLGLFDKDPTHIGIVSRKTLFKYLKETGLEIIDSHYFVKTLGFHVKGLPGNIFLVVQKK